MGVVAKQGYARYSRVAQLGGLEMLAARFREHRFVPHYHAGYAIGVFEDGALAFKRGRRSHLARAGHVVVIHPHEVHEGQAVDERGWTYRMIYPDAAMLASHLPDLAIRGADPPSFAEALIDDPWIARDLVLLHRAADSERSSLTLETLVYRALSRLVRRYGSTRTAVSEAAVPAGDARVRRVRDYLDAHYDQDVRLAELSQVAGLSPYYLLRSFKRATGFAAHAYLLHVRIRAARRLLLVGVPCSEVAAATGFYDQSHFTNRFRRVFGVTPDAFRTRSKNFQDIIQP